ncbi:glycosyltransferase [Microbispora siamensis]
MRIAHVINQFPPNITAGLGRYAELIAPHLARDHEMAVFTLNDGRLPVWERSKGVTVYRPRGRVLGAVARRRRLNRTRPDRRPDLVAVHDSTNFLCGLQWWRALPLIPLALTTTRRGAAKPEHANSPAGILSCGLALAGLGLVLLSLPFGLFHPLLPAVPAVFAAGFVLADPELVGFVRRERGPVFAAYFMAVHLVVHVVLVTGLAVGSLRLLTGPAGQPGRGHVRGHVRGRVRRQAQPTRRVLRAMSSTQRSYAAGEGFGW